MKNKKQKKPKPTIPKPGRQAMRPQARSPFLWKRLLALLLALTLTLTLALVQLADCRLPLAALYRACRAASGQRRAASGEKEKEMNLHLTNALNCR